MKPSIKNRLEGTPEQLKRMQIAFLAAQILRAKREAQKAGK